MYKTTTNKCSKKGDLAEADLRAYFDTPRTI